MIIRPHLGEGNETFLVHVTSSEAGGSLLMPRVKLRPRLFRSPAKGTLVAV
jgi:hypothetical protein